MTYPTDLKYTRNDEWVRAEGASATCGITHYAQEALSDIVYVELPPVGEHYEQGAAYTSVESVKAAAEVYVPVSGTITAVNEALSATPELINSDPYGAGWIARLTLDDAGELGGLMDAAAYERYCEERKQ
ncbi:MAG: glycine cleavage system protein GcvH [Anaerolineales bacterium]|nr:glycine cleavage system protein GcvH [Anaerolineales bacterium]